MKDIPSFRLEDLVLRDKIEKPIIGKQYINERIAKYRQTVYGDNTFCIINLRPLFCGCESQSDKEPCSCDSECWCDSQASTCSTECYHGCDFIGPCTNYDGG